MGVINKLFGKYLFLTNVASCGLTMVVGDMIEQRVEYLRKCARKRETKHFKVELLSNKIQFTETGEKINTKIVLLNDGEKNYKHDYERSKNMLCTGFMQGPFLHFFYKKLDRLFPGKSAHILMKKVVVDQSIASPSCIFLFYVGLGIMERQNLKEIADEFRLKFLETLKLDIYFWPPIQLINFILIPAKFRVIYLNTMVIIYNALLSHIKFGNSLNHEDL